MNIVNPEFGLTANELPFVRSGQGSHILVIFPGLGDALQPMTAIRHYYAWAFRRYANSYTVYVISRKRRLPLGTTTKDMAVDYATAIEQIGPPVHILGLSMGSIVAQHLAADFPRHVRGLVLSLSGAYGTSETIKKLNHWVELAKQGKWRGIYMDTVDITLTGLRRRLWRHLMPLVLRRPEIPSDFIVSAEACIHHDARDRLGGIAVPTLVLGGTRDKVVPEELYRELARLIPNASLCLLDGGHGVYVERKRKFESSVIEFLRSRNSPQITRPWWVRNR